MSKSKNLTKTALVQLYIGAFDLRHTFVCSFLETFYFQSINP